MLKLGGNKKQSLAYIIGPGHKCVKRICRYVFNDSKSTGLRPDRNDCELNVQEEIQKVYAPKTR